MERVRSVFLALMLLLASIQNLPGKGPQADLADFSLFEENGKVGLKNEEGRVLIPAEYDAIGWSNGSLSIIDRVVGYQNNGLWGLITTSNKVLTAAEFLELNPGEGSFLIGQKKSPLSQRPSFGVLSTSGKTAIPFIYDALRLSNMRAVVMSRIGMRYLFGLADLSHKIIIPLQYQRIHSLGSLRYAVENFENKTSIFSEDGVQVTPFNIDSISSYKKDYAIVYQNQRQGVIDRNGRVIAEPVYAEVQMGSDGTILVRDTHQWFLLRGDNSVIKRLSTDGLKALSEKHYVISAAGKFQLTGNDFTPLHADVFSSVSKFENGMAVFRKGTRAGVISSDGRVIIEPEYRTVEVETGGFRVCIDAGGKDRWLILDLNGKPVTEKQYEYIGAFNGKFYPVKSRGYWGALNVNGEEIITCVHDSLVQELHNNIVVRFKGEYGVMNLQEHWVVTPQPHRIRLLTENTYLEFNDNTTFLKSFAGDLIYFSDYALAYEHGYIREQLPSGAYWVIDMSGIVIDRSNQPLQAEKIFPESEGLRAIRKDGKFGFIDEAGRLRIANRYEDVQAFSDGLAAIKIRGKWGFIDHQERLVIQPVYDRVENFNNGMAIVWQEGRAGLIDDTGKVILPMRYDHIAANGHNRYVIGSGKFLGLADSTGAVIIHPRYDQIVDTGSGYIIVERAGKFGLLTLRGVSTIPMIYDSLTFDNHHNQFVAMKKSEFQVLKKE